MFGNISKIASQLKNKIKQRTEEQEDDFSDMMNTL